MSLDPLPADVTLIPVQGRHHHVVTTRHGEGQHISQQRTTKRALRTTCRIIDLDVVLGETGQLGGGDGISLLELEAERVEQGLGLRIHRCAVTRRDVAMDRQHDARPLRRVGRGCAGCKNTGDHDQEDPHSTS